MQITPSFSCTCDNSNDYKEGYYMYMYIAIAKNRSAYGNCVMVTANLHIENCIEVIVLYRGCCVACRWCDMGAEVLCGTSVVLHRVRGVVHVVHAVLC